MENFKVLFNIQQKLRVKKNRVNTHSKYKYRSCEDILEALRPLLSENDCVLTLTDELVEIGGANYVKAIVRLINSEGEIITNTAYAREGAKAAGMCDAQITGSTSSYARKYALAGLFMIDDSEDSDSIGQGINPDAAIIESIKRCKTMAELKKAYTEGQDFVTDHALFSSACSERKREIQQGEI